VFCTQLAFSFVQKSIASIKGFWSTWARTAHVCTQFADAGVEHEQGV